MTKVQNTKLLKLASKINKAGRFLADIAIELDSILRPKITEWPIVMDERDSEFTKALIASVDKKSVRKTTKRK
jgi:hypothetical protein